MEIAAPDSKHSKQTCAPVPTGSGMRHQLTSPGSTPNHSSSMPTARAHAITPSCRSGRTPVHDTECDSAGCDMGGWWGSEEFMGALRSTAFRHLIFCLQERRKLLDASLIRMQGAYLLLHSLGSHFREGSRKL